MKKIIIFGIILMMLSSLTLGVGGYFINRPYTKDPHQVYMYELKQLSTTLKELEKDRIIFSARLTSLVLALIGYDKKVQKGIYEVNNRMSTLEIINMWMSGKQKIIEFTIQEGHDIYDIGQTLLKHKMIDSESEWLAMVQSPEIIAITKKTLGFSPETKIHNIEGLLFPETYYFFAGNTALDLINIAVLEFKKKNQFFLDSALSDEYKLAVFKVASFIEKETLILKEKPIVASVIYNRLKINKKLELCSSLIYTLRTLGKYDHNLKYGFIDIKNKHFNIKSRYNSYYTLGLPPTPISSFSLSSLQAAIEPAQSDYLFFIVKEQGKPNLGHYFTTNYDEHLKHIERLLQN